MCHTLKVNDYPQKLSHCNPTNHTTRLSEEASTTRSTANILNNDTSTLPTEYDNLC